MSISSIVGLLGPFLVVAATAMLLHLWWRSRDFYRKGYKLPGRKPLPIFGNVLNIITENFNGLKLLTKICEENSGLAAFWQGYELIVIISDPKFMKSFYMERNMINRADQYGPVVELLGAEAIFASSGEAWKRSRKRYLQTFTPTPVQTFINGFSWTEKYLLKEFGKHAQGKPFTSWQTVRVATSFSILKSAVDIDEPDEELQSILENELHSIGKLIFSRQFNLLHKYSLTLHLTPTGYQYRKDMRVLKKWFWNCVDKKKKQYQKMKERHETIPNMWIYNSFERFGEQSHQGLADDLTNIIISGVDTTSNTLCYALLCMAVLQDMQDKIVDEDRRLHENLRGRQIDYDDLEQAVYLERFLKEVLRLFPVAEIVGRKLVEDTYFGEFLVPEGANILALPILTFRDPKSFPDPLRFNPDRYLPENAHKIDPYAYTPFSMGPRNCPGMKYAMIGMKMMISAIVRNFKVETTYTSVQEIINNAIAEPSLVDSQRYPLILTPRNQSEI